MALQNVTTPVTGTPISSSDFGIPVANSVNELNVFDAAGQLIQSATATTCEKIAAPTAGQVLGYVAGKWGGVPGGVCLLARTLSTQNIDMDTETTVTFDTEEFDSGGFADLTAHADRITIPTGMDGYYQVSAGLKWQALATDRARILRLYRYNSSDVQQKKYIYIVAAVGSLDYAPQNSISVLMYLAAGDYVQVKAYHTSDTSPIGIMADDTSYLSLALVYKA